MKKMGLTVGSAKHTCARHSARPMIRTYFWSSTYENLAHSTA